MLIVVTVAVVVTVGDYCDCYSLLAIVPDVSPVTVRCTDCHDWSDNMLVLV